MKLFSIKIFTISITLLSIVSCNEGNNKNINQIISVKLEQTPLLSSFVDRVEYIKLPNEIRYGFIDRVLVTKDYFILADYEIAMKVYVLNKDFEMVSIIDRYGEGPGEYLWLEGVNYNEQRETIEVLTNKDLIRYSTDGEFVASIRLPLIFGNLVSISENEYLVYSRDVRKGMVNSDFSNSVFILKWNSENGQIKPVISDHKKNVIGSTKDRHNMFRYKTDVYATHVYMDTVFKIDEHEGIHKIYVDLEGQNLPMELIYGVQPSSVLNREEIQEKYAVHYPGLMVNDNFFIDMFAKYNRINFFIQDKRTSNIISGRKILNDLDNGLNYLNPWFLDQEDNLYTIHQYEHLKEFVEDRMESETELSNFVKKLDPQTGFVVGKYHLKQF
ncbi:6-bladed beta-propeller [Echinicola sp. CAU 1574]|uniref:6-bladed beta-propeller n=1 Tax=Echinicola arenosa TaxID=2774144 RepID=A0ABR9AHY6_9BACT|nr:6-bladed beta-propeller [Echinicola arenosa]MBD8487458.1 6-bladed beta-propeller [Echinicola arenosa]